ncbi:MAG: hypothetical protein P8R54_30850 [Myxococcota bacterium]|nr:hypothetical protein [Myxococcota bacterium]
MSTERALLIEQVVTAYRERDGYGTIKDAPAWHDLDGAGRTEAFEQTVLARAMEAALDPDGLSTTARAVLDRIVRR